MYIESVESDKVYKYFADQLAILHANCNSRKYYDVNRFILHLYTYIDIIHTRRRLSNIKYFHLFI